MPAWGETQVGRGSAKSLSASGETGGWQKEAASERFCDAWWTCWLLCPLVNAAELRDLTSTVFKTYLVPSSENVAFRVRVGSVPAQLGLDEGVGEQNT